VFVAHVGDAVDVGVNVYVVVAILFKAGDQLPTILLLDVVGNALNVSPEQIDPICVKAGVVSGLTVTSVADEVAEQPLELVITTVYVPVEVAV
jgi:hypothetical protein